MDSKRCSMCGESKPLDAFGKRGDRPSGLMSRCRPCHNAAMQRDRGRRAPEPTEYELTTTKMCRYCMQIKPLVAFSVHSQMKDGRLNKCKECAAAFTRSRMPLYQAKRHAARESARIEAEKTEKYCPRCQQDKPATRRYFYAAQAEPDGLMAYCKVCVEALAKFNRDGDPPRFRNYTRMSEQRARIRALQHYSGLIPECACCGDTHLEFLVIDHINGGGNKQRKELGKSGAQFLAWLASQGYPEGFRVLCHSCNMSRGFYGYCPHEREQYP